jgi:hypothetical protein
MIVHDHTDEADPLRGCLAIGGNIASATIEKSFPMRFGNQARMQ